MKKMLNVSLISFLLTFCFDSYATIKGSQDWLRENGLANQNLLIGDAFEIVNNKSTSNQIGANLEIIVVGYRLQISTSSNPRIVQMTEMSLATPRGIALMEKQVSGWDKDRSYLEVVKRDDGRFYVRFRDENRNGFEGIVTNVTP
jgi:hypothetical protein